MVETFKIFFSGTKRPMILKLCMQHWLFEYYKICSNDDPGLTLTYFTARSNLVPFVSMLKLQIEDYEMNIGVYMIK